MNVKFHIAYLTFCRPGHGVPSIRRCSCASLIAAMALLLWAAGNVSAVEMIRNGGFSGGMTAWKVNPSLGEWDPVEYERASLEPPDYDATGLMIYQNINATIPGNQYVDLSMNLEDPYPGTTNVAVEVYVDFIDGDGHAQQKLVMAPAAGDITNYSSRVAANFLLSSAAARITKLRIHKNAVGVSGVDDVSMQCAGATTGALPQIVSVSPPTGQYGTNWVVLAGTGFGSSSGTVALAGSSVGLEVGSWTATSVAVRVNAPAVSGRFTLFQDGVESDGDPFFLVSSPYLLMQADKTHKRFVKGQQGRFVIIFNRVNAWSEPIELSIDGLLYETFSPPITSVTGGNILTLDTSDLLVGTHVYRVDATTPFPGTNVWRSISLTVEVANVSSAQFYKQEYNTSGSVPEQITSLNFTQQRRQHVWWRYFDMEGNELPTEGAAFSFSDPSKAMLMIGKPGTVAGKIDYGSIQVSPLDNGSTDLHIVAPDGFATNLPTTVAVDANTMPYISTVSISPAVIDSRGSDLTLYSEWISESTSYGSEFHGPGISGYNFYFGDDVMPTNWCEDPDYFRCHYYYTSTNASAGAAIPSGYCYYGRSSVATNDHTYSYDRFARLEVVNAEFYGEVEGNIIDLTATNSFSSPLENVTFGKLVFTDQSAGTSFAREIAWETGRGQSSYYWVSHLPQASYYVRFQPDDQSLWCPVDPLQPQWVGIVEGQMSGNLDFIVGVRTQLPTVKVYASDNTAIESTGDEGLFFVTREGADMDYDLTVNYAVSGTAQQYSDYELKQGMRFSYGQVTITSGTSYAELRVVPIDNAVYTNTTVRIELGESYGSRPAYWIGGPSNAVVSIYGEQAVPWQDWRTNHFSTTELTNSSVSGADADPENDGQPNLVEYALARDPRTENSEPVLVPFATNGTYVLGGSSRALVFTQPRALSTNSLAMGISYVRRKAMTDATCHLDLTTNLLPPTVWYSEPTYLHVVEVVDDGNGITETVRVGIDYEGPSVAVRLRVVGQ